MRDLNKDLISHNYRFLNTCLKEANIKGLGLSIPGYLQVSLELFESIHGIEKLIFISNNMFKYYLFLPNTFGGWILIYTKSFNLDCSPVYILGGNGIFNQNFDQN